MRRKFSAVFSPVVVRVRNQERARVRLRYGKGVAMKIKVIWTTMLRLGIFPDFQAQTQEVRREHKRLLGMTCVVRHRKWFEFKMMT